MAKRVREAEEIKRRKMARTRFRNLIRSVAFNRIWLVDAGDTKGLSLNVKKNISMLVRTQRKIGMLTLADKSLIRTHPSMRSVEDRKKLVTLMANLTCFSKIPPKVRARITQALKFIVINPGRVLIKEGQPPITVYFILTGELEVTRKVYDHLTNSYINKVEMIIGPGECLGDVEMIERIPRRHTYTATSLVELLLLYEDDFDELLRPAMEKQWYERKTALKSLDYFKSFTEDQILSACKISSLRQFDPLETIYYEDKGQLSYVHFVISGECMILQCLKMNVFEKPTGRSYELVDLSLDTNQSMFEDVTGTDLMKMLRAQDDQGRSTSYNIDALLASDDEEDKKQHESRKIDLKSIEKNCGLRPATPEESESYSDFSDLESLSEERILQSSGLATKRKSLMSVLSNISKRSEKSLEKLAKSDLKGEEEMEMFEEESNYGDGFSALEDENEEHRLVEEDDTSLREKIESQGSELAESEKKYSKDAKALQPKADAVGFDSAKTEPMVVVHTIKRRRKKKKPADEKEELMTLPSGSHSTVMMKKSVMSSIRFRPSLTSQSFLQSVYTVENHFIDVGSMTCGGIFGLGEKMEHRVIMARTTVQCLMIPRFWLLEKTQNPGNIWQRRCFYLDCTIPSRQLLFKDFISTRHWQKFKKNLIESHVYPTSGSNPTHPEDVPVICRIVEATDD